jgi:hypothetical protein
VNGDKTTPNNKYIAKLVQKDCNLHVHVCKCFSLICTKKVYVYVMLDTSQGLFPSDLAIHLFFSSWNCAMFLKYILQDSSSFCYLDMLDNWQFLKRLPGRAIKGKFAWLSWLFSWRRQWHHKCIWQFIDWKYNSKL